jgi:hypothetical protein
MFGRKHAGDGRGHSGDLLQCSFCGKSEHEVQKLIAGPKVLICDECVQVCVDIIADDATSEGKTGAVDDRPATVPSAWTDSRPATLRCTLCQTPTPAPHLLPIPSRGALCPGCVGQVEAAAAARRESES